MADAMVNALLLVEALEEDECFDIDDDFMSDVESEDEENSVLKSVFISAVELSSFDDITSTFNLFCSQRDRQTVSESSVFVNSVRRSSDDEFSSNFRMTRSTFQHLQHILKGAVSGRTYKKIPLETKLWATLWLLATPDSFRSVGNRFNLSKGTIHGIFVEVINAIASLSSDFVKWPEKEERKRIAEKLQHKFDIPGIIGMIDCCHIYIKAPKAISENCFNRKYYHTIVLQAVCDDTGVFRDLFVGGTGKAHNSQIFQMSPIFGQICDNPGFLESEEHLLGNSEYPLMANLLIPFKDNEHLSPERLLFNSHVNSANSIVKKAFSLLKNRWQRLRYLDMGMKNFIPKVIAACCCLHNFILNNEDVGEIDAEDDDYNSSPVSYLNFLDSLSSSIGEQKREEIINAMLSQSTAGSEDYYNCTYIHSYSHQIP